MDRTVSYLGYFDSHLVNTSFHVHTCVYIQFDFIKFCAVPRSSKSLCILLYIYGYLSRKVSFQLF